MVDDKEISIQDLREIALSDQSAELTLRSKFFDRYQSLSDYSRSKEQAELPNGRMYSKAPQLKKLEGFERVMAACLTLGEYDHHAHNLGVVERGDGRFEVVKIDHGLSGSFDYDVETAQEYGHGNSLPAASELAIYMEQYKYKNIPFDLQKFKDSLDEMVPALKAEAQTFIDRSVHELDSLGVEKPKYADYDRPQISPFNLLEAGVQFEPEQYPRGRIDFISLQNAGIEITTEQYDKALALTKSLLVKQMEKRLADVEKLSEHMELFAKMEPRIPGYKFFAGKIYAQQDPIQYAIDNGKRIDGLDPIEYRSLRDMNSSKEAALSAILRPPQKIGDVPVLDWAADNRDKIKHFDDILIFASEYRNLEIKGKEVLLWAAEEKCPIERKDAVAWAKEKALMIEGKDPILWAFEQKGQVKIEGQYPLRYAAMKGHKIKVEDGQELTAEEFAKKRGVKVEPQIAPRPEKFPISTNVAKEATLLVTNVAANIVTKEKDGPVPAPRQKNLKKAAVAAVKEVRGVKAGKPAVKAKPQDLEAGMKKVAQEVREGSKAKEVIATKSQVSKAMQERLAMFETKPTRLN